MKPVKNKKRVLVYPCGTEIALEIFRSVSKSTYFELVGGSSTYDHGRFVYIEHIDNLPFITDESNEDDIRAFNGIIEKYHIDMIYPAMDGVLTKFSEYRDLFSCQIICPEFNVTCITRSKRKTYELFKDTLPVPKLYQTSLLQNLPYPLFIKPDVGQGSSGAVMVNSKEDAIHVLQQNSDKEMLLMEYLPGDEYTIDCFTNNNGDLIYVGGRGRKRIKNGISVNAVKIVDSEFRRIAEIINSKLKQRGGWFFQLKKNNNGEYSLLEVASRIAGASTYARSYGINLPLMTLFLYTGNEIQSVLSNNYDVELDRALYNKFKLNLTYSHVYVDYDDTVIIDGKVNTELISFLYQCINENIPITLLTKHDSSLRKELIKFRLSSIFDDIIQLDKHDEKYRYISNPDSIFIDDSFGERGIVAKKCGINVFDTNMIECLLK